MMDDIGADAMSSWIRDEVFGVILQYRMQEQLPTFFSSNFSMQELEKHLSVTQRGESEPLKAKRIMERIRYLTKEIQMTGKKSPEFGNIEERRTSYESIEIDDFRFGFDNLIISFLRFAVR